MTMLSVSVGRVAVAFHDERNPSDAEWNTWVALYVALLSNHGKATRGVIYTLGGAPNASQRAVLGSAIGGKAQPSAVLTTSALTRGAVTAISWLGIPVRAFKPDNWVDIRQYLELNDIEARDVQTALTRIMQSRQAPNAQAR